MEKVFVKIGVKLTMVATVLMFFLDTFGDVMKNSMVIISVFMHKVAKVSTEIVIDGVTGIFAKIHVIMQILSPIVIKLFTSIIYKCS